MKKILSGMLLLFINFQCSQIGYDDDRIDYSPSLIQSCYKESNTPITDVKFSKNQILTAIAFLESTGGKNRVHSIQTTGIHQGTYSYSSWGLMPTTIKELSLKSNKFSKTILGQKILKLDPKINMKEIHEITIDKNNDLIIAEHLWDYNKNQVAKFADKNLLTEVGAYAWRYGINAAKDVYTKFGIEKIRNSEYVHKFNAHLQNQTMIALNSKASYSEQWVDFLDNMEKTKDSLSDKNVKKCNKRRNYVNKSEVSKTIHSPA